MKLIFSLKEIEPNVGIWDTQKPNRSIQIRSSQVTRVRHIMKLKDPQQTICQQNTEESAWVRERERP